MPQGPNPNGTSKEHGANKMSAPNFLKPWLPQPKPSDGAPSKGKYQFVNNNEDGAAAERTLEPVSRGRRACAPVLIVLIASLILVSQLQLSFETKYEYDYDLSDIKDGGEGETYSFNLWKGAQEVGSRSRRLD